MKWFHLPTTYPATSGIGFLCMSKILQDREETESEECNHGKAGNFPVLEL